MGAGIIKYTISFSNNTNCNLIWQQTEYGTFIRAEPNCTQEMKQAIKDFVRLKADVNTDIQSSKPEHKKGIQSIIKNINIDEISN